MAGGEVETDVLAALRQGLTGVLANTGMYLPRTAAPAAHPSMSLASFASLPALLEQLS